MQRYKNNVSDPASIGKALGVRSVVTGRVTQARDNLAIASSSSTSATAALWGERSTGRCASCSTRRRQWRRAIAGRLRPRGSPARSRRASSGGRPKRAVAYELYWKGRFQTAKCTKRDFRRGSGSSGRRKSGRTRRSRWPYEGLAYNYVSGAEWALAPRDAFPWARAAAQRALELDPTSAEAHAALGFVSFSYDWDWAAPERSSQGAAWS